MMPAARHEHRDGAPPLAPVHRWSGRFATALAVAALLAVLSASPGPPARDEGTAAHIFQLAVMGAVLALGLFLATADWRRPWPAVRRLVTPVAVLAVAFRVLYMFEHGGR